MKLQILLSRHAEAYSRRRSLSAIGIAIFCAGLLLLIGRASAFSLLGPYADWMDVQKGYRWEGEIGGPMNIHEGYRWNLPVLTYGFDRSFLDYFGTNGVAAVEEAISMLNELPPASQIDLSRYALHARRRNWQAESLSLIDLKSYTVSLLLQEMGLADPSRYAFCIRDFQGSGPLNYSYIVIERNFDSVTAQPSHYVNEVLLSFQIPQYSAYPIPGQIFCDAQEVPVDAEADNFQAVTSMASLYGVWAFNPYGAYITNLTADDVAGLRYLLSANQVRGEILPDGVYRVDTNAGPLVSMADRPGVEKITFVRHPVGTLNGRFLPFTNNWTDIYYDFFFPGYQQVERVTTVPDVVFTARELSPQQPWERTGTTNWTNLAEFNGNAGGTGPGVIRGPITIAYNTLGPFYLSFGQVNTNAFLTELDSILIAGWGSYSGSTNPPVAYPVGSAPFQPSEVRLQLAVSGVTNQLQWPLAVRAYERCAFQTSTNLLDWLTLATLTNSGAAFEYQYQAPTGEEARFFRTTVLSAGR